MRGDGPVGEAQYRRGPLLGHQVAEGREEPPQLRGLRQQFRELRDSFAAVPAAAPATGPGGSANSLVRSEAPMGTESGHPAGRAGRAPPALSRPMATE